MGNLWQQKRLKVQASCVSEYGEVLVDDTPTLHVQMMLRQHQRDLKRIQSFERKAQYKQKILPLYVPWVDEVLKGQSGVQDDVLMFVMLWRIDAGDYAGALDIAEYALKHRLKMPGQQTRSTGCAVAEEMADAASRHYALKNPLPLSLLERTFALTLQEDMPDKVKAKLYKYLGFSQRDNQFSTLALISLKRALSLDKNVGAKTDIKQLEKINPPSIATSQGGTGKHDVNCPSTAHL